MLRKNKALMEETEGGRDGKMMERYTVFIFRENIVKMTILPKAIHRFHAILIKIPMAIFPGLDQIALILHGNTEHLNSQNNFKRNRDGGIHAS